MWLDTLAERWEALVGVVLAVAFAIQRLKKYKPLVDFLAKAWAWVATVFGRAEKVSRQLEEQNLLLQELLTAKIEPEVFAMMAADLSEVRQQFQLNGGSTLRDEVMDLRDMAVVGLHEKRLILEALPLPICRWDASGRCLWANRALQALFGMGNDEFHGWEWLRAVAPEHRSRVADTWRRAVANGYPYDAEYEVINQVSGDRFKCWSSAQAIAGFRGTVRGYHGTIERIGADGLPPHAARRRVLDDTGHGLAGSHGAIGGLG